MLSHSLDGIKVIDFTHRLPGPLAGHILAALGANVIKIEDKKYGDAFLGEPFKSMDSSFESWYKDLNKLKDIKKFDFKNLNDIQSIKNLINDCDILLLGIPPKVQQKLEISNEYLKKLKKSMAIITMEASKEKGQNMHDLNALAHIDLLKLHIQNKGDNIVAPPFLPTAGITFGQQIATCALSTFIKAQKENCVVFETSYLLESSEHVLAPFWPKEQRDSQKFLHNGKFPCYNLYKCKSGEYFALAAVEEKFWVRFCELSKLDIPKEKRFESKNIDLFHQISSYFLSYTAKELLEKYNGEDICLNFVGN